MACHKYFLSHICINERYDDNFGYSEESCDTNNASKLLHADNHVRSESIDRVGRLARNCIVPLVSM